VVPQVFLEKERHKGGTAGQKPAFRNWGGGVACRRKGGLVVCVLLCQVSVGEKGGLRVRCDQNAVTAGWVKWRTSI